MGLWGALSISTLALLQSRNFRPLRGGSLGKLLLAWNAIFIRDSRPRCVTSTECVWTSLPDSRPLARNNPVYSRGFPFPTVSGVLPVGATILPQQVFSGECSHHSVARASWVYFCGIAVSEAALWARHSWIFNPQHETNTMQTVRAHVRFVGLVCSQLESPRW